MLHLILLLVCRSSFVDFCRTKACCVIFRDIAEDAHFYREVDFFGVEIPDVYEYGVATFMFRCQKYENLSVLFIRGAYEIFRKGKLDEGLDMIRRAACKGYGMAIYAYANIKKIAFPEADIDPVVLDLDRQFVRSMRRAMESIRFSNQHYDLPYCFARAEIRTSVLSSCDCYVGNKFQVEECSETSDSPGVCDSCFWIMHTLCFLEKFPGTVIEWPE